MKLKTEDAEYMVHFTHMISDPKHWSLSGRMTICTVHEGECANDTGQCLTPNVLSGVAHCSRKDTFSRAVGRKLAFGRAIKPLSVEVRTQLWEQFLPSVKIPKRR